MDHNHTLHTMNQKIFKLNLSVETISAYLLCCSIVDLGQTITTKHLLEIWNGSEEDLAKALSELEDRNIIQKIISDREEKSIYKLNIEKDWKT